MRVLALDTALFGCSAAFCSDGKCVAEQQAMQRGQAELLVPMVQRVLDKAKAEFSDIDLIVTTVGPGAFTGLRIGISTAQGFGISLGKPVVGVTTMEILAAQFFEKNKLAKDQLLCVLIETKREDYYCQFFNADGSGHSAPQALSDDAVRAAAGENVLYIGDALKRFAQNGDKTMEGFELPDPRLIAARGLELHQSDRGRAAEPLYLREADVSTSKKEQREILENP